MKIGILTYHNAYNYGAVLQAYALQTFLQKKGHDVEIIDYHNKKVDLYYSLFGYRRIPKRDPRKFVEHMRIAFFRKPKFNRFRKNTLELLNLSKRIRRIDDPYLREYDIVIIGSDQLWNKIITGKNDKFYWGEFAKYTQRPVVTYAICMNSEHVSDEDQAFIKKHLCNFSQLSVREVDLAAFMKQKFDVDPEVSLDPTLMVDEEMWSQLLIEDNNKFSEPYVCVYPVLEREKVIDFARKVALEKNMKLVILYPIAESTPEMDYYIAETPVEFINIIAHSRYMVTSSFHGLAFSIIFKKEVLVLGDSGKNVRMKSLLGCLGMRTRFIDNPEMYHVEDIDYEQVGVQLGKLRAKSQDYLTGLTK